MKFDFVVKHRETWPEQRLCGVLGVSRHGVHAWLDRAPSARATADAALAVAVRASFVLSDRPCGERRILRDLHADGHASACMMWITVCACTPCAAG